MLILLDIWVIACSRGPALAERKIVCSLRKGCFAMLFHTEEVGQEKSP